MDARRTLVKTWLLVMSSAALAACGEEAATPCVPEATECPNACDHGTLEVGAACTDSADCACGLLCKVGSEGPACAHYSGDNAGCLCEGVPQIAPGLPALGNGSHSPAEVLVEDAIAAKAGLQDPTDLAFDPDSPGSLWVTDKGAGLGTEVMVIIENLGTAAQSSRTVRSPGTTHFMAQPAGLAFGEPGEIATIHDTDQVTQYEADGITPATATDFMGPTLFSTNPFVFDAGHGAHLDMLHNSPLGGGIAWERERVFWVFDGAHAAIARYDFNSDHGLGGADHSDGVLGRYAEGEVERVEGVPSNMVFDPATSLLFVADSGHARIAALDTTTGSTSGSVGPNYDGTVQQAVQGAELTTFFEGSEAELEVPSGLAIHEETLYISDNETSRILAVGMDGVLIDYLDTELAPGSLRGLTIDDDGVLYVVDAITPRILRIAPGG